MENTSVLSRTLKDTVKPQDVHTGCLSITSSEPLYIGTCLPIKAPIICQTRKGPSKRHTTRGNRQISKVPH